LVEGTVHRWCSITGVSGSEKNRTSD